MSAGARGGGKVLRLGSRGSPLALWQAEYIADRLRNCHAGLGIDVVTFRTTAEKFPDRPLHELGTSVFTRELDEALLRGAVDLAVHSLKDLASEMAAGLALAAVPTRESPADAFISADGRRLEELPPGARIGTASPRRQGQILAWRRDLGFVPLRGNVATRLRKIEELSLAGTVLAVAGLRRLGEESRITHVIPTDILVPAVSQGALAIVCRNDDAETLARVRPLEDPASRSRIRAERGFLRRLRGGCQVPAGALATLSEDGKTLQVLASIASPDGSQLVRGMLEGPTSEAEELGVRLAESILERGGDEILASLRGEAL